MFLAQIAFCRQMPMNVFHHHDRAIDHHTDADGEPAKGHQVRAQAVPFHHNEGEERGQWEDQGNDYRTPNIGEKNNENRSTKIAPSASAFVTVLIAFLTRSVRS